MVSIFGTVVLVCRRVLRLQSLRLDVSKRWHRIRRSALSDADRSNFKLQVPGEMKDVNDTNKSPGA